MTDESSGHLFAAFFRRAADAPDGVFCHLLRRGVWQSITNAAIADEAGHIAARLRGMGVAAGAAVPIVLEHRPELYSSFIGCSLAGAVPAFLSPLTAKQDPAVFAHAMAALLARIDPPCVIASAVTRASLHAAGRPVLDIDAPAPDSPAGRSAVRPTPNALALLQHSSGTTGLKKGVMLTHGAVLRQIGTYAGAIGLTGDDVVASWLPLYHDMGLITSFLMPAVAGIPIVSLDALEWTVRPTLLLDAVERFAATLCWLPNFAFHHIARLAEAERRWNLRSLRLVVNCSEPCRAAGFDAFLAAFASSGLTPEVLQVSYAMAENVFAVTQTPPGMRVRRSTRPDATGFLSCGKLLTDTRLRVVRENSGAASCGELGEILITGDCLFDGYFRQPELSAARLRDGWFATGDLGFVEDGELFVVGRLDDVLNINGRKIMAHEVEHALAEVGGVAPGRVLVYAEHDKQAGATRLEVAAELDPAGATPAADVMTTIRRRVVDVCGLWPARVLLLERGFLLKSTSGKISRAASLHKLAARRGMEALR